MGDLHSSILLSPYLKLMIMSYINKGGHNSPVNNVLGGQNPPVNNVQGDNIPSEYCLGGHVKGGCPTLGHRFQFRYTEYSITSMLHRV